MPTLQQKYDFLLSKLRIEDVDPFENDAMIGLPKRLYFQFSADDFTDKNKAVIAAMQADKEFPCK